MRVVTGRSAHHDHLSLRNAGRGLVGSITLSLVASGILGIVGTWSPLHSRQPHPLRNAALVELLHRGACRLRRELDARSRVCEWSDAMY